MGYSASVKPPGSTSRPDWIGIVPADMHRNDHFVSHSVFRLTSARLALASGLLALTGAAVAQDAAPAPATTDVPATEVAALNLPQGPTNFLAPNPNVRRATA